MTILLLRLLPLSLPVVLSGRFGDEFAVDQLWHACLDVLLYLYGSLVNRIRFVQGQQGRNVEILVQGQCCLFRHQKGAQYLHNRKTKINIYSFLYT